MGIDVPAGNSRSVLEKLLPAAETDAKSSPRAMFLGGAVGGGGGQWRLNTIDRGGSDPYAKSTRPVMAGGGKNRFTRAATNWCFEAKSEALHAFATN